MPRGFRGRYGRDSGSRQRSPPGDSGMEMIYGCSRVATRDSGTASVSRVILGVSTGHAGGLYWGLRVHCGNSGVSTGEVRRTWGNSWFSTGDAGVVTRDVGVTNWNRENLRLPTGTPGMRVSQSGNLESLPHLKISHPRLCKFGPLPSLLSSYLAKLASSFLNACPFP